MHAYAHTIIAMERVDAYRREADAWRLGQLARSRRAPRAVSSERRFDPMLTIRELRRVVLRRVLGEAATA